MSNKKSNKPYYKYKYNKTYYKNKIIKSKFAAKNKIIVKEGESFLQLKAHPCGTNKWNFYKPGGTKDFIDYIVEHQMLLEFEKVNNFIKKEAPKSLKGDYSFMDYMNNPIKQHKEHEDSEKIWHYSDLRQYDGKDSNNGKSKSRKCRWNLVNKEDVNEMHPKSHIWSMVISEKDSAFKDIMFKTQHGIAHNVIRAMFDFPVNAVISYHGNTPHPHIHIMVYQPKNIKASELQKKYFIDYKKLYDARRSYQHFLLRNNKYINDILKQSDKTKEILNQELLFRLFKDEFLELNKVIENSFEYGRLNKEQRQAVEKVFKKILDTKSDNKDLIKFQNEYEKFQEVIEKAYIELVAPKPTIRRDAMTKYLKDKEDRFHLDINNKILKTLKKFREVNEVDIKRLDKTKNIDPVTKQVQYNKNIITPGFNKKILKASANIFNDLTKSLCNSDTKSDNTNFYELKKLLDEIDKSTKQSYYKKFQ